VVKEGLQALPKKHHRLVGESARSRIVESLDIDEALRTAHPSAPRWDYLIGDGVESQVLAVEPHSAETSEVPTVIAKRRAAIVQLRPHLRSGARVVKWLWIASGRVDFVPHDRVLLRLAQEGIEFVGRQLEERHLAARPPAAASPAPTRRRPSSRRRTRR
jgi:hypothetical protein